MRHWQHCFTVQRKFVINVLFTLCYCTPYRQRASGCCLSSSNVGVREPRRVECRRFSRHLSICCRREKVRPRLHRIACLVLNHKDALPFEKFRVVVTAFEKDCAGVEMPRLYFQTCRFKITLDEHQFSVLRLNLS